MHIVTKILMVFCAVLSLLLAALTMAYASNANAIKASMVRYQSEASSAKTEAGRQIAEAGQDKVAQEERRTALETALRAKEAEVAALQAERTDLRSREQSARSDADSIRNQIAQVGATVETQAKLIANYRDEVTALRQSSLATSKREIELLDKINDLSSAREVLEQNARALKEQLEATKLDLQTLQSQGAAGTNVTNMAAKAAPRELPGPLVRAHVTETFKSPAGDEMVVINEGSNRGLKENVLMNIARGDSTFVASIVIITVEPTRAVGKVTLKASAVQKDDTVLSRLE